MAPDDRDGADDLTLYGRLRAAPRNFHVFLALRLLEARYQGARGLGQTRHPDEDAVRLGQPPELAFPPVTVSGYRPPRPATAEGPARPGHLGNLFFGFYGPNGPLPTHLTEYARARLRHHDDPTLVGFTDMLTHRFMSLLYRAWATGQAAPSFDRAQPGCAPGADPMGDRLAALGGHLGAGLAGRDAMPDLAKRHFAGHLGRAAHNASGLEAMLGAFLSAPVRVQQFVGTWLRLEPGDRWQLGQPAGLGQGTSIGNRVWSRSAKFRLRIGPLTLADYRALLPGGRALPRIVALVRNYVGDALDWDLNLVLRGAEVPRAELGRNVALGHVAWIGRRDSDQDADDIHLAPLKLRGNEARTGAQGGTA